MLRRIVALCISAVCFLSANANAAVIKAESGVGRRLPPFLNVTLTYFDIRGLAEPIRLYLSSIGVPFSEKTVGMCDDPTDCDVLHWPDVKASGIESGRLPFGQVPMVSLRTDAPGFEDSPDLILVQSHAILRFWSKQEYATNSALTTTQEAFFDMLAGGVQDMRGRYSALVYSDSVDDAMLDEYVGKGEAGANNPKALRTWLAHFERLLETGEDFFHIPVDILTGVDPVSYVPALVWDMLDTNLRIDASCLAGLPRLQTLHQNFARLPGVAKYLSSPRRRARANGVSAAFDTPTHEPRFDVVYAADGSPSIIPLRKTFPRSKEL